MAQHATIIPTIMASVLLAGAPAMARVDSSQVAAETLVGQDTVAPPNRTIPESELRPLGLPQNTKGTEAEHAAPTMSSGSMWWFQTIAALVFVVGLIFIVRVIVQKLAGRSGALAGALGAAGRAPSGVLEVLGRYPVARGQSFVLLRLDRKILLLAQTASGYSTLTEVSDPDDVASLVLKTRDEEGASNAARFNELLKRMERDPSIIAAERGDEPDNAGPPIVHRGHFGVRGVQA